MSLDNNGQPVQSQVGNVSAVKPNAARILNGLPDGNRPMDILNAIVSRESPNSFQIRRSEPNNIETIDSATETFDEPQGSFMDSAPIHEAHKEVIVNNNIDIPGLPKSEEEFKSPDTPTRVGAVEGEENVDDKELNFRRLSKVLRETKTSLKEKEDALQIEKEVRESKEKELEDIKTGKVLPDAVMRLEEENQKLKKYEKIYGLKSSPEWFEKRVKPMQETKKRLVDIGLEYRMPEDVATQVVNKAIAMEDASERSRFLSQHFEDIDALEVKTLIKAYQQQAHEARMDELEPDRLLEEITQQAEITRQTQETKRHEDIDNAARTAWTKALTDIRADGKAFELIPKGDDKEYNEKYVDPIVKAGATEFGKFIANLKADGIKKISPDTAYYLAKMSALAHASSLSIETRATAVNSAQELLKNTRRNNNFIRPSVGQQQAAGNGGGAPKTENRESRVEGLLQTGRAAARR